MKVDFISNCSKSELTKIRTFVAAQLSELTINQIEKDLIILAIDEACANAIVHGNDCDQSKQILVALDISESRLNVEISDVGENSGLPERLEQFDLQKLIESRKSGGIGLKLIHSIMDKVQFIKRNDRNVCSLTKTFA